MVNVMFVPSVTEKVSSKIPAVDLPVHVIYVMDMAAYVKTNQMKEKSEEKLDMRYLFNSAFDIALTVLSENILQVISC